MNTFLIRTITDIEMLIKDWKAGLRDEKDFKAMLWAYATNLLNDRTAEDIDRDLEAGKTVMGHKLNPKTGKVEEVVKYEKWVCDSLVKAFGLKKLSEQESEMIERFRGELG